jgi:hypothetical protein
MASYYGYGHEGSPAASGEPFDPQGYTAAHKTLPFGTQLGWATAITPLWSPSTAGDHKSMAEISTSPKAQPKL